MQPLQPPSYQGCVATPSCIIQACAAIPSSLIPRMWHNTLLHNTGMCCHTILPHTKDVAQHFLPEITVFLGCRAKTVYKRIFVFSLKENWSLVPSCPYTVNTLTSNYSQQSPKKFVCVCVCCVPIYLLHLRDSQ